MASKKIGEKMAQSENKTQENQSNETEQKEGKQGKKNQVSTPKKTYNFWKGTTLLLLGLILGGGIYLVTVAAKNQDTPVIEKNIESPRSGDEILNMTTEKKKVNELIDHYLKEYLSSNKIKYEFYLENQALLKGNFQLLGYPMSFFLYFDPYVMENGNIQLKAQSLSIGSLGVPMKEVLKYIKGYFDFPKWIEIKPDDSLMVLHLDELDLSAGLKVKAEKIDLIQDEIKFSLYLNSTKETEKENDSKK